ncbi:multidrug efflux pump subunit AcrB [Sinobacterium caligoides]|uniref:Multidrug efflux pump subunit AcrB n=1 Tax=Sinobacterium caligoides TaxID=933926 RepID=A0A3N2DZN4_9GAMM|nr:efflux RND transporter permease subunit [Sinobacterium caligoides]ROS05304.1 multidrug efflux pump subunit AcrB [Sinobacterium caligoides]
MNSLDDSRKGIIAWFANNPVAANLLMIFTVIIGIYSAMTIKKTLAPEYNSRSVSVVMAYPGANTAEVERGVILKIEEAIKDIESIDSYDSMALDSLVRMKIDVADGYTLDETLAEVKTAVDAVTGFPQGAERAVVAKMDQQWQAIQLQLYGPGLNENNGKWLADQMKRELLANTDIASVMIYGTQDYEVAIEVPEQELRRYGLTLAAVKHAVQQASVDISAGSIKTENGEIRLRANAQAYRQHDFEAIELLAFDDGTRLLLGDIATVKDGFKEARDVAMFNDTYSIALAIFAVGPQDLVTIASQAKAYVAEKKQQLPPGVELDYWADTTYYLQGRLDMMLKNLAIGALLVFIILGLFIELNIAFWVMLGIPVCFLGALAMLPLVGVSINLISLFGFILVLGIVVDDAIIIAESVHSSILKQGDSLSSVISGAQRVATPATFGVLTTICAFMPTLFISGSMANFPAACGFVVLFCLLFSLIESKWILPAHLAHRHSGLSRWIKSEHQQRLQVRCNALLSKFIEQKYLPFLRVCIRERYTTMAVFVAIFILTIGLMAGGWIRYVMTPDSPNDYVEAKVEMVRGTSEQKTMAAMQRIKQAISEVEVRYLEREGVEQSFIRHSFNHTSDGRIGSFMLELSKQEERIIGSQEIVDQWREAVGEIVGAKQLSFSAVDDRPGGDIAFNLVSDDAIQLRAAANELEKKLASYDGLSDITNGIGGQMTEVALSIKPSAQALGLSMSDIALQVRQAFYGVEAQRIQRGADEVRVMVRYPLQQRESFASLENMTIRNGSDELPLLSVVEIENTLAEAQLNRIDGQRAAQIAAKADKSRIEPQQVSNEIIENYLPQLLQKYPAVSYELDGSSQEAKTMEKELFVGFFLALLGIYALLAVPLRSYSQPVIIMCVIPFGLIGAVFGHAVLGMTVSMMSIFGIIALAGVVVNDSLIMVDFINRSIERGSTILDAVLEAGGARFRAILLTSLTTFFGVLPMLLETSVQAQFVIPMAVSLGFGIIFATVITLLLIPCLYMVLADLRSLFSISLPVSCDEG